MATRATSTRKVSNSSIIAGGIPAMAITNVYITDNSYNILNDTAISNTGGYIRILGVGFLPGYSLYLNGIAVASSTYISTGEIRAITPSIGNGSYNLTLFNTNNTGAIYSLTFSGFPTWTTGSYVSNTATINVQLLATGDGTLNYYLQGGSTLPTGVTLSSTGLLSGTISGAVSGTLYSFTVLVDDSQLQTSQQALSLTLQFNDTYWKNTTLMLNGETSVTPFISDASTNSFGLTIAGDTKPVLFNPYQGGYYSVLFSGASDYLTVGSTLIPSTGDFTIEFWIYSNTNAGSNQRAVFSQFGSGQTGRFMVGLDQSSTRAWLHYNGTDYYSSVGTLLPNIWYHYAFIRSGDTFTIFLNGTQVYTNVFAAASLYQTNSQISGSGGSFIPDAYISNMRIITGQVLYTGAFTPPTSTLTTSSVGTTGANVAAGISGTIKILTCQSNRFVDNSTNAYTITLNGSPKISPAIPFTQNASYSTYGSTYFDGTGDYLTIPDNTALQFGSGNWTVEFWVYLSTIGTYRGFFSKCTNDSYINGVCAGTDASGNLWITATNSGSAPWTLPGPILYASVFTTNRWYHVAIVRNSNTITGYVNGVAGGTPQTLSGTVYDSGQVFNIGSSNGSSAGQKMDGYINDFRFVKGTAVYTTAFTPPTTPLTPVANTSLLTLQYNGGANNQGIIDNSNFNNIITRAGNVSQGTFSPYSVTGWSVYFNGTTDYMFSSGGVGAGGASFGYGTGDFTWELWIYPVSSSWTTGNFYIIDHGSNGGVLQYNTNFIRYYSPAATAFDTATGLVPVSQWTHIAVSRVSQVVTIYVNGTSVRTGADTSSFGTSQQFWLGRYGGGGQYFPGYMSNVRIVKGVGVYTGAFTPPTSPLTPSQSAGVNIAAITGQTSLLICQSNKFVNNAPTAISYDSGTTFNLSGTPSVQAFSPFGSIPEAVPISYSNYFDGTGDQLLSATSANLALQSSDFTVELWYYPTGKVQNYPVLISNGNFNTNKWQINDRHQAFPTKVSVNMYAGSSGDGWLVSTTTISVNAWYHVALVRSGSTFTLYINGVSEATNTYVGSITASTDFITLGQDQNQGVTCYTGYISNARIVKGTAVYTSNFTPSTTPLTAIANTQLLTCQSTRMIDNSTNYLTITANGDTKPLKYNPFGYTAQSATSYTPSLHGGSAYFDGTGDYISAASNALHNNFGTSDFGVEGWFYFNNITGTQLIFSHRNSNTGAASYVPFLLWTVSGTITIYSSSDNGSWNVVNGSTAGTVTANQWYHIAYTRTGNTFRVFVNGVQTLTFTSAASFSCSQPFQVGMTGPGETNAAMNGYVSDVRMTKGISPYSANFVPPTQTLTNYSTTYPASLLLNMNNGGIIDQHSTNVLETVGNAQLSTAVKKYNNASMYFDGTGDYLTLPYNKNIDISTGDFTIESWVYATTTTNSVDSVWGYGNYGGMLYHAGTTWSWEVGAPNGVSNHFTLTGTASLNAWHHIACTRYGSTFTLWIDGVSASTNTTASDAGSPRQLYIGWNNSTGNQVFTGYIDDLRITKGFARYTGNFSAPTISPPTL